MLCDILAAGLSMQFAFSGLVSTAATERFTGGLYGVTATVDLDRRSREAKIELSGFPLGGRLHGTGRFKHLNGIGGDVELDDELAEQLAWRMVTIEGAAYDQEHDSVVVQATLPIFGHREIQLSRVV